MALVLSVGLEPVACGSQEMRFSSTDGGAEGGQGDLADSQVDAASDSASPVVPVGDAGAGSGGGQGGSMPSGGAGGALADQRLNSLSWRTAVHPNGAWIVNADVDGSSANDVYVAGYVDHAGNNRFGSGTLGFVDHYDGNGWQARYETGLGMWGVWVASPTLAFAVGEELIVRLEAGVDPVEYALPTLPARASLNAVSGSGPGDVVAVGFLNTGLVSPGVILHYDGREWVQDATSGSELWGVWVSDADNAWAVGRGGLILHRSAGSWLPQDSGTTVDLNGVWGTGPGDVYAVGGTGEDPGHVILHYDGDQWLTANRGDSRRSALNGVHGLSKSEVYAVGGFRDETAVQSSRGELFGSDGITWTEILLGSDFYPWEIWCAATRDCFIVGPLDTLARLTL